MQETDSPDSPQSRSHPVGILSIAGVTAAVALFLGLSLILIVHGSPLGHDESVYSLRARHFIEGVDPAFYWKAYRAPGFPVVLQVAWLGSGTEPFLRLVTALFGIPLLLSTWFIGSRMFGAKAATIGTFGVALTPVMLGSATQVWPDVPGAAIGLTAVALYVYALDRERASPWMLGVPALVFLATMLRFGAPVPVAIALIGITLWRSKVALEAKALVAGTAMLTIIAGYVVLYVPAVTGWAQLSNPISPAVANASLMANNDFPWYESFVNYARFSELLIGGIAPLLLAIGLAAALIGALRRTAGHPDVWAAVGIGFATFAALALILHGEPRYLTPVLPWFWLGAGYGLAALVPKVGHPVGIAVAVVLLVAMSADSLQRANITNETNRGRYTQIKAAGNGIDDATEDNECGAVAGSVPQIGWYSHCPTMGYDLDSVVVDSPYFGDGPTALVFVLEGKRQPEGETLSGYLATATGPVLIVGDPTEGQRQYAEVWVVGDG